MNWRSAAILVATLAGLVATVVAAILEVTAQGDSHVLAWVRRNPDILAWMGLGTSSIAAIGAYLIMRSRAKEEYRTHWHPHGH
jgi:hypothetical protein